MEFDDIKYQVRGAAMEVYNYFGPGLLESVYEKALIQELQLRGLKVQSQVALPIMYKGVPVGDNLRIDLLVEIEFIVELKSVETIDNIFKTIGQKRKSAYQFWRIRFQKRPSQSNYIIIT